jgi:hypothetical protein
MNEKPSQSLTKHLYNEAMAREICDHIKQYFPELERTFQFLRQQFQENREGEEAGGLEE